MQHKRDTKCKIRDIQCVTNCKNKRFNFHLRSVMKLLKNQYLTLNFLGLPYEGYCRVSDYMSRFNTKCRQDNDIIFNNV